jgi:phosphatidylglycerol:prolipoprotein diacylglycerol transferase
MYLVAFLLTFLLFRREAERSGLTNDRDLVARFFTWIIVGALLGGRLLYVFAFDDALSYLRQPWLIVWPFSDGQFTGIRGMSYHGGLLGVVAGLAGFSLVHRVPVGDWADALAVSAPLGYTFGRLGNFINGELPGRVTTAAWGVIFPNVQRYPRGEPWVEHVLEETSAPVAAGAFMVNLPRHPSQLYEALLEGLLLWAILWFVIRPRRMFRGSATGIYIAGYGFARFVAEYFRATDETVGFVLAAGSAEALPQLTTSVLHLTLAQIISLGMIALGIAAFFVFRAIAPPEPTVETFGPPDPSDAQTE